MALLNSRSLWQPSPRASQVSTQQEQPDHPQPRFGLSVLALPPTLAVIATVLTGQEVPKTPPSWTTWPGPIGPATTPPSGNHASTTQEQPYHPGPTVQSSVAGPNVAAPPQIAHVSTVQEYPSLGSASTYYTPIPSVAAPPQIAHVTTVQEKPDEPAVWAKAGVAPPANFVSPAISRNVRTVQEYPDLGSGQTFSRPVPNVASLPQVNQYVTTAQEPPFHPVGWASIGTPPTSTTFTLPAVTRLVLTVQEYPDLGRASTQAGVAPPANFAVPPLPSSVGTVQEQPYHPGSVVQGSSLLPVNFVSPAVSRYVVTVQEQPDLGRAATFPGVPPPANFVSPAVSRNIATTQEQPDPGRAQTFTLPPNVASAGVVQSVSTRQEYPDLGYVTTTLSVPATVVITPVPPSTSYVVTVQEYPQLHPVGMTLGYPGVFGNGPKPPSLNSEWLIRARRRGRR